MSTFPSVQDEATPSLSFIWSRTRKHDQDLYEGNGRPSLTTRMLGCEDRLDGVEANMAATAANTRKIVYLLLGAMVTALADVLVHSIHFGR